MAYALCYDRLFLKRLKKLKRDDPQLFERLEKKMEEKEAEHEQNEIAEDCHDRESDGRPQHMQKPGRTAASECVQAEVDTERDFDDSLCHHVEDKKYA